jgi:GxxExxY protein
MHFEDEPTIYADRPQPSEEINELARRVIGIAIELHRELGPGLPEEAYEEALAIEFEVRGITYQRQLSIVVEYRGRPVCRVRLDFLIESKLVLEVKSCEVVTPIHRKQTLRYLRVLKLPLGLIINFNVMVLKDGVHRVYRPEPVE